MSADETLVLIAGILFLIGFIIDLIFGALGIFSWMAILPLVAMMDAMIPGSGTLMAMTMMISFAVLFVIGFLGLIFAILCLKWRSDPKGHKTGLIVIGIIAIIFSVGAILSPYAAFGFIPGLLALIGALIAK
jgi:hypothetical protein